jgi:hypothetical protein
VTRRGTRPSRTSARNYDRETEVRRPGHAVDVLPSLTIDDRYRINYKFDLDFNLPGDWYLRVGIFENFDSLPSGLSRNDYGWSNSFGLKF